MNHDERKDEERLDLETVDALRDGLGELERHLPVFTPDLKWFENQVEQHRTTVRKRLWKELSLFIGMAIAVLALLGTIVLHAPSALVALQFVSMLLVIPAVRMHRLHKRVER